MSNSALAVQDVPAPHLVPSAPLITPEKVDLVKKMVAKDASDAELQMFIGLANRYRLDPLAKQIWFIKDNRGVQMYTSRDGYLAIAQRDPRFRGLVSQPVRANDEIEIDVQTGYVRHRHHGTNEDRGPLIGAWAQVRMQYAPGEPQQNITEWIDYNEYYGNSSNPVLKKYPSAMATKCADVRALKKALGLDGLITTEEMAMMDATYTTQAGATNNGPMIDFMMRNQEVVLKGSRDLELHEVQRACELAQELYLCRTREEFMGVRDRLNEDVERQNISILVKSALRPHFEKVWDDVRLAPKEDGQVQTQQRPQPTADNIIEGTSREIPADEYIPEVQIDDQVTTTVSEEDDIDPAEIDRALGRDVPPTADGQGQMRLRT